MAENPVLKEARRANMTRAVSTSAENKKSAAAPGGSANPVVREFYGETTRERTEPQEQIDSKAAPAAQQEGFDFGKFLLGTLGKGANAIAKAGSSTLAFAERAILEPLFPGITQSTPIQDLNKGVDKDAGALQNYAAENLEKGGKTARIAENVGVGVIAAVPQAVVAAGTGGASLGAQGLSAAAQASPTIVNTLKTGVSQMAKNPNYWTSFLTTVGNNYEQAKANGADDTRASLYALADSLIGSAVETAGGIQTLPAELQGGRFTARKWIDAMLDEGKEEVVQGVISRGLENVVYNKGNAIASVTDQDAILNPLTSAEEFGMGAAVGGILGGAQGILANTAQNPAGKAAGAQSVSSEGKFTPTKQTGAQGVFGQNKAAPNMGAGEYRASVPQNVERPAVPVISMSRQAYANTDGTLPDAGNSLRGGAIDRAKMRLHLDQNVAAYIPASNVVRNGEEYVLKITKASLNKMLSPADHSAVPLESIIVLDNIERIANNGVWKSGEGDRRGRPQIQGIDHLMTTVYIDSEPYVVDMRVRLVQEAPGKNADNVLYYFTPEEIVYVKKAETSSRSGKRHAFTAHGGDSVSADTRVAHDGASVNVKNVDPLLQLMMGGKRVDQSKASDQQFAALADRGDIGVDAAGKLFQVDPAQHIDRRTFEGVGSRKVNAFQFDHPQLHSYFQQAARALIADADISRQFGVTRSYERGMQGNKVNQKSQTSAHLRRAMDETGLSRSEIIDAAQRIVNDKGQENVKAAKQVEIILDDMLTHGWRPMMGEAVEANEGYIRAKNEIAGSQPETVQSEELPVMANDGIGAANAGFDPYSHLQNQTDRFHPEGAYAARPVDVPTTNLEGRNIPKAASTIMGAQGIDDSDVRFLERQIADGKLAFDTIRDTDAVARAQTVMQEKGFDGALEQYRQAVAGNVATKDNTALGQQLLLQAMREGNTAYTAELLTLYTRNSTTAAQAMQAQSIFRKLSPEGQLMAVQKAVADLNTKYGTDVRLSEEEVADFLNAETPEARQAATDRIMARAAESVPGTFRAKYDTLRYLAMLGNPRTHIRNILGNTFFQVPVAVKNRVGAVAEVIAYKAGGGKTERTKALFGVDPLGKLAAEARADWANARGFLEQTSKYAEGQASLSAIEQQADAFSNSNILGRGVNKAADLNSRALAAEDTAAKKWIYTQSLAGYLKANGCRSIADADVALLNRARNYAAQEALRGTFNDRNTVSNAVSLLGAANQSSNKAIKAAGYVVEGVLPFKRTPANIAVRAVEYSPIGVVLGAVETMRGAKGGDMARVSTGLDRVAAGVSGTALLAAGFLAAGAGYVTGGEDEDEKQRSFDDLTGHQNYALELKDGTSVTLDWLAPEAIPFFMGVELHESMLDGGVSWDEAWGTVKNAASPMLEMSMLQGLNDTFENAAYAKNRGDSVLGSLLTSALTNYATQIVPTLGGQIERSGEEVRMTTYTEKDGGLPTDVQYTLGKVSQKIPGWDYRQIPYIDAWGRTEATGDPLERAANNLFNPAYVSQVEVDELEAELQRLKDETGSAGVFPERAERSITVDGEKKNLTAEEYQQYATILGQNSYALVKEGISLAAYRAMDDTEKVEYVDRLYQYATQTAKASVSAYQTDAWVENARRAQTDIGVSTAEYIALYEKYGSNILSGAGYEKTKQAVAAGLTVEEYAAMTGGMDADGNGSVSQKEAQAYLDRQPFAAGVKADLWTIIDQSWKKNPYA